jgi:hypothetical protein
MGASRIRRGVSALATAGESSERMEGRSNDKRATTPETANGCTRGAKL